MAVLYHLYRLATPRRNISLSVCVYGQTMAYDPGAIDAALAAAVGDEPALIAELRGAFLDGVTRACTQLEAAETVEQWRMAAARLRGLSASFGAVRLMGLAALAAEARPGDPDLLAKIRRAVDRL